MRLRTLLAFTLFALSGVGAQASATVAIRAGRIPEDHWGPIALYIDGAMVMPDNRVDAFSALRPGDVEAVEVYRSPTELPAEAMGNACGAIYVWTRFGARVKSR